MLLDLAPEIQIQIMQFCSPDSLSSLSRVQTLLRDIADHLLYSHIHFYALPLDLIQDWRSKSCTWALKERRSLLHTLIANARKAGMVKTLYIELETVIFCSKYSLENLKALHSFLAKLSEALQHMPNLADLRIVHDKTTSDVYEGSLSQAIRGGYSSLHTLCLDCSHDLEGIIADQPHLRYVGIHYDHSDKVLLMKIQGLYQNTSRRHTVPAVFTLHMLTHVPMVDIWPSFHRPGDAPEVCREIVRSLSTARMHCDARHMILSFCLLGISDENINLLNEAMEATAACLNNYGTLCEYMRIIVYGTAIQKPWQFPEFIKCLALFETVGILIFHFYDPDDDELRSLSQDLYLDLTRDMRDALPKIRQIKMLSETLSIVLLRKEHWLPRDYGFGEEASGCLMM